MSLQVGVGTVVRRERERYGLTQTELAQKTGVSQAFISQVERGIVTGNLNTLQKLALGLNTPLSSLIKKVEDLDIEHAVDNAEALLARHT